eukprot:1800160-Amphidinium_carterae.1
MVLMQPAALHPQPHSGNPLGSHSRMDSTSRKHIHRQLVDHLFLDVVPQVTLGMFALPSKGVPQSRARRL